MPAAYGTSAQFYAHQADAYLSQANPVSGQLYTVLATTANARIITFATNITWAANQPTPLEIVVTIDGQTIIFPKTNPVTATWYFPKFYSNNAPASMEASVTDMYTTYGLPFILEGQVVKVEARITWPGPAQPTPLVCRVKYARWM